jgi:hypothetical protein
MSWVSSIQWRRGAQSGPQCALIIRGWDTVRLAMDVTYISNFWLGSTIFELYCFVLPTKLSVNPPRDVCSHSQAKISSCRIELETWTVATLLIYSLKTKTEEIIIASIYSGWLNLDAPWTLFFSVPKSFVHQSVTAVKGCSLWRRNSIESLGNSRSIEGRCWDISRQDWK